ncbi:MAG: class I SAM-dependent methyltransferase [Alphaproteobacteria bacterium]|nr:class I SAM-dependent methyltransferase [Alphaproteobacteria bacterium]
MSRNMIMMTEALYDYLYEVSDREPAILAELRAETEKATPWFGMQITPMQGQFMQVLLAATGARKVLEVGTFTGYSALAMAMALPEDGRVVTLDINDEYTSLGRKFWEKAGLVDKIDLRLGPASETLKSMVENGEAGSYDFAFIDADKVNYPDYWDRGLTLLRKGGLIVADNTLFQTTVTDDFDDAKLEGFWRSRNRQEEHFPELIGNTHAIRAFNKKIRDDERVHLAMVPVGDGMTIGVKL